MEKITYSPITSIKPLQVASKQETGAADLEQSFSDLLNNAMNQLQTQEKAVEQLNGQFIRGESADVHSLMINSERLSLGLELTVQVRNKAIEAYQEIMRMQI